MNTFRVYEDPIGPEINYVVDNLRQSDEIELNAWGLDPEQLRMVLPDGSNRFYWSVHYNHEPVFIVGLVRTHGNTFTLVGFGTPEVSKCTHSLSRWAQDEFLPVAFDTIGVRRIEARVPMKSEHSWPWLLTMGMKIETKLNHFGANGEDFVQLAYTADEFERDYEDEDDPVCVSSVAQHQQPPQPHLQ